VLGFEIQASAEITNGARDLPTVPRIYEFSVLIETKKTLRDTKPRHERWCGLAALIYTR
jgi:hypothetical protein